MSIIELTKINEPIKFIDPEVKRRCINAGWDLDGDGEISYAEASLVKDIGRVFSEICEDDNFIGTRIQSFDEFQFFIGVDRIPAWAFGSCYSLQSIIIPCTVKSISEYAFYGVGFKSVILPDGLMTIGERAFEHSALETINIPQSVKILGDNPFYECPNIRNFKGKYTSKDGRCLIDGANLIAFAPFGLTEYTIPEWIAYIGYGVFSGCHLSMLRFSPSLRSVGDYALHNFEGTLYINSNIEEGSFILNQLSTVIFGPNVTTVSNYLSWSYYLENVIFEAPDKIMSIQDGSFAHCHSLKQITLPPNIKRIGKGAFENSGLTSIEIPNTLVSLPKQLFAVCEHLSTVTFSGQTKEIGSLCFAECKNLERIIIPRGVTTIGEGAFASCSKLKEVMFPDTLEIINEQAFINCERLVNICLPESLKKIGERAFCGCKRVRNITFPNSNTLIIDKYAFCECGVPAVTTNIEDSELLIQYINNYVFGHPVGTCSPIVERYRKRLNAQQKGQTRHTIRRCYDDIIDEEEFRREMIEGGLAEAFNGDDFSRWNID